MDNMVIVQLTNGFGNNLFQYIAARQLAEFHNCHLRALPPTPDYYAIKDLQTLGVKFLIDRPMGQFIEINDHNYKQAFDVSYKNYNFLVRGYFEDYTLYEKKFTQIRTWFPKIEPRNDKDLVIHFRGGDRLFYKNEFDSKPTAVSYDKAISKFDFNKLFIVTDMPLWKHVTTEDLQQMNFHYNVPEGQRVEISRSVDYFNSIVDALEPYCPILNKGSVLEDFNYMRTFKNILFQHGTLGWWAAILSDASQVGVYGPWRPWKGLSNKNLSQIKRNGWFQWK